MPGRPRCRSWYLIAMTLLVALQAPTPAWAWGRLGHGATARIAEKYQTAAEDRRV